LIRRNPSIEPTSYWQAASLETAAHVERSRMSVLSHGGELDPVLHHHAQYRYGRLSEGCRCSPTLGIGRGTPAQRWNDWLSRFTGIAGTG
jgi:hypothetical protein